MTKVTNNEPVPFNYIMDWQEVYLRPDSLIGVAAGQEILNEAGRRVGWEQRGVPLGKIGFKETKDVPLGSGDFMATWQWVDKQNPVFGDALEKIKFEEAKEIAKRAGSALVSGALTVYDILGDFMGVFNKTTKAKAAFQVHIKDEGKSIEVSDGKDIELEVPEQLKSHFYWYYWNLLQVFYSSPAVLAVSPFAMERQLYVLATHGATS